MSLTEILKLVSPLASSSSSSPTGTNPFIAHLSTVNYKDIVKVANYSLLIEITPEINLQGNLIGIINELPVN